MEQGKTLPDAEGDVLRGIQVVEYAIGVPALMLGDTASSVAKDMDINSFRIPIGVTAGICPCVMLACCCFAIPRVQALLAVPMNRSRTRAALPFCQRV